MLFRGKQNHTFNKQLTCSLLVAATFALLHPSALAQAGSTAGYSLSENEITSPVIGYGSSQTGEQFATQWTYRDEQKLIPPKGYVLKSLAIGESVSGRPCSVSATFEHISDLSQPRQFLNEDFCGTDPKNRQARITIQSDTRSDFLNGLGLCVVRNPVEEVYRVKGIRGFFAQPRADSSNALGGDGFENDPVQQINPSPSVPNFCANDSNWMASETVGGARLDEGLRCSGFSGGDAVATGLIVEYQVVNGQWKNISGFRLVCRQLSYTTEQEVYEANLAAAGGLQRKPTPEPSMTRTLSCPEPVEVRMTLFDTPLEGLETAPQVTIKSLTSPRIGFLGAKVTDEGDFQCEYVSMNYNWDIRCGTFPQCYTAYMTSTYTLNMSPSGVCDPLGAYEDAPGYQWCDADSYDPNLPEEIYQYAIDGYKYQTDLTRVPASACRARCQVPFQQTIEARPAGLNTNVFSRAPEN